MFTLFIMTTLFLGVGGGPFICLIGLNVKMKCFDPGRWTCLTQWDLLELLRTSPVNFLYQLCASPLSRSLSLCSCALYLLTKALRKETRISIRANAKEWKVGCSWKTCQCIKISNIQNIPISESVSQQQNFPSSASPCCCCRSTSTNHVAPATFLLRRLSLF